MIDATCARQPGVAVRARMRFAAVLATAIRDLAEAQPAGPRQANLPSRAALAANGAERR